MVRLNWPWSDCWWWLVVVVVEEVVVVMELEGR